MKKNSSLLFFLLFFGMVSLFGQKNEPILLTQDIAKAIVEKIKADPELPYDGGNIIIIGGGICGSQDCVSVFNGLPVNIFTREDLFVRGLQSFYKIIAVNQQADHWQVKFQFQLPGGKQAINRIITGQ